MISSPSDSLNKFVSNINFSKFREISSTKKTCNFIFELSGVKAFASFKFGKLVNLYVDSTSIVEYLITRLHKFSFISEESFAYLLSQELSFYEFFEIIGDLNIFAESQVRLNKENFIEEFLLTLIFDEKCVSSPVTNLALTQELSNANYFCLVSFLPTRNVSIGQLILSKYEIEKKLSDLLAMGNYAAFSDKDALTESSFLLRGLDSKAAIAGVAVDQLICSMPGFVAKSIALLNDNVKLAKFELQKVQFINTTIQGSEIRDVTSKLSPNEITENKFHSSVSSENCKAKFYTFIFELLSLITFLFIIFRLYAMGEMLYTHFSNLLLS